MSEQLPAAPDPGTQVTLRVATPVGPISVVGEIVEADSARWSVRRRDGSVVLVEVSTIEAKRVVPPGRSVTVTATELQQISAFGWRSIETVRLGEWLLRASGGFTRRSNSALAVGDPGVPLGEALSTVSTWYGERGLVPTVSIADGAAPAGLSEALATGGWQLGVESHVMAGEIAHALLGDPRVLILDEPANGLDPAGIRWMRGLLREFADRGGAVLLSSHLLHEIEVVADRLVVIGRGRAVAQGTKAQLLAGTEGGLEELFLALTADDAREDVTA